MQATGSGCSGQPTPVEAGLVRKMSSWWQRAANLSWGHPIARWHQLSVLAPSVRGSGLPGTIASPWRPIAGGPCTRLGK